MTGRHHLHFPPTYYSRKHKNPGQSPSSYLQGGLRLCHQQRKRQQRRRWGCQGKEQIRRQQKGSRWRHRRPPPPLTPPMLDMRSSSWNNIDPRRHRGRRRLWPGEWPCPPITILHFSSDTSLFMGGKLIDDELRLHYSLNAGAISCCIHIWGASSYSTCKQQPTPTAHGKGVC